MEKCKHEKILKAFRDNSGDYWECLVGHYKEDGSAAPACIQCPDCNEYIGWQEQAEMRKAVGQEC